MWKGAPPEGFSKAQSLRNRMTDAEIVLWNELKGNRINGYKFRRQHPIHFFIVDFYCHKLKLIIEIDGKYHETKEQKEKDEYRTKLLQEYGLKVIRFTNEEVLYKKDLVLNTIEKNCLPAQSEHNDL